MTIAELKCLSSAISWPRTVSGWLWWATDSIFVGAILGGGFFNLLVLMMAFDADTLTATHILGPDPAQWVALNMLFAILGVVFRAMTTVSKLGFSFKGPSPTQWATPAR